MPLLHDSTAAFPSGRLRQLPLRLRRRPQANPASNLDQRRAVRLHLDQELSVGSERYRSQRGIMYRCHKRPHHTTRSDHSQVHSSLPPAQRQLVRLRRQWQFARLVRLCAHSKWSSSRPLPHVLRLEDDASVESHSDAH